VHVVADNAGWHKGVQNCPIPKEVGYQLIPWLLQLPDLNLIENVWNIWKGRLRKRFSRLGIPGGTLGGDGPLGVEGTLVGHIRRMNFGLQVLRNGMPLSKIRLMS